jgi:hypothetical protein
VAGPQSTELKGRIVERVLDGGEHLIRRRLEGRVRRIHQAPYRSELRRRRHEGLCTSSTRFGP